jgi:hypothetical protein
MIENRVRSGCSSESGLRIESGPGVAYLANKMLIFDPKKKEFFGIRTSACRENEMLVGLLDWKSINKLDCCEHLCFGMVGLSFHIRWSCYPIMFS